MKVINRIVSGSSAVAAETALKLAAAFRTSPEFWLNAQHDATGKEELEGGATKLRGGAPPKVVWLQVDNAGTQKIADLLTRQAQRIRDFEQEGESALLIVREVV